MNDTDLVKLERRLGRLYARQRLGIETDHEAQIFGLVFFHLEDFAEPRSKLRQDFTCVQRSIEIDAANRKETATSAKRLFCEQEHLADWKLHADEMIISEPGFPS